jgi:transcriptional regulator with XRE-family HTH domain
MSHEDIFINGELLRLRREARGWVLSDLATRACMSVKQIRQLEEGGMSSFYSPAVKMTSAKKVGNLLGLSAEEVFGQKVEASPEADTAETEVLVNEPAVAVTEDNQAVITPAATHEKSQDELDAPTMHTTLASEPVVEEPKSKTSLWIIVGLFTAALAVAAYMQPHDEPAVEPAPPLQTLPADVADPASAASAAEMPASSAELVTLPASTASGTSAPRMAVQPASATIAAPAAPSASKAP